MDKKSLVALIVCAALLTASIFGAYQIGYGSGSSKDDAKYQAGYNAGVLDTQHNSNLGQARVSQAYDNGYQAGLKAQSNSTGTG